MTKLTNIDHKPRVEEIRRQTCGISHTPKSRRGQGQDSQYMALKKRKGTKWFIEGEAPTNRGAALKQHYLGMWATKAPAEKAAKKGLVDYQLNAPYSIVNYNIVNK